MKLHQALHDIAAITRGHINNDLPKMNDNDVQKDENLLK
jgi:hypothetical protein